MDLFHLIAFAAGFIAGIFVYRNNSNKMSGMADKIDEIHDKVKDNIKK